MFIHIFPFIFIIFGKIVNCIKKITGMTTLTVSMTGFSGDPREEYYKELLSGLGIRFTDKISGNLVLIVK